MSESEVKKESKHGSFLKKDKNLNENLSVTVQSSSSRKTLFEI